MTADARGAPAPLTIVFAHQGRDWIRGSEQCLLDLVERLDPARFRSVVLCDAPALARAAVERGAHAEHIADWGPGPVSPRPIRRRVMALLREHDARLVHANMPNVLPSVIPAGRVRHIPVVAHLHLTSDRASRMRSLLHQATAVVGVAEHVVAELRTEVSDPTAVRVIANGVDPDRMSLGDTRGMRTHLGIPPDAIVAASVGSLIQRKGHDLTIRAVAGARARGLDVRLLVCGDGEEGEALRGLACDLGVGSAVHFLGVRRDVGAVLRDTTDIYLSAARDEALPLNILEAQWAGLPIVCSDIPAHQESMLPGRSGDVVRPEDPAALADALVALSNDATRRTEYGDAGRALVAERFSIAQYVCNFMALYDELLARPRTAYGWVGATQWPIAYNGWLTGALRRRLGLV